jgi:predicted lipase
LDAIYTKWSVGKVHSGFYDRFREIRDPTVRLLKKAREELPNGDIIISGHSMGGAIATLFGSYLTENEKELMPYQVYTYGSPRVGNREFSNYVDQQLGDRLLRIMNEFDMVTDLPPFSLGYRHTGNLIVCKTGTSECEEKGNMKENSGGMIKALKRLIETTKNVNKCHLTYLDYTIGTRRYKCV